MSLISYRPFHLNAVVGQPRAIRVLKAILTQAKFLPRGIVLEGIRGVGKTSVGYILSRALMCPEDPLGCGHCASCLTVAEHGIDQHPDFMEVDAASNSGVEHARNIVQLAGALPVLGKRRIIMVDEAHNTSRLAWDVYLKPLELKDTNSIYIFVSNEGDKIPETIRSRCAHARFQTIPEEMLLGLLCNCANAHSIPFDLDAMKLIAKYSRGIVRDAYMALDTVAAMGLVTRELVQAVIDTSLEDSCLKIFAYILRKDQVEASKLCDDVCRAVPPYKVIEAMFELYGRSVFKPEDPTHDVIRQGFSNISQVTSVFIKWNMSQYLPADVMPLFVYDLISLLESPSGSNHQRVYQLPSRQKVDDVLTIKELVSVIGADLS